MSCPPEPNDDLASDPGPAVPVRPHWPNVLAASDWSGGSRSSLTGGDYSAVNDLEPELLALLAECDRRVRAGEVIDINKLAAEHPAWAVKLRWFLPSVQIMAEIGEEAVTPAWDDSEAAAQRAFRNFRIIREVGRGGMGIVYEAQQAALGRHVALKVLPLATALDPRALQRFQLEAQVAGWLQHPRIVPVYAVGLVGDVPYFAMRFIEGGSLAELIAELGRRAETSEASETISETGAGAEARPAALAHTVELGELADQLLSGRFAPPRRDPDSGRPQGADSADGGRREAPAGSIQSRAYIRTVVWLGIQAAEALDYAHGQGVVHRDIKPANLLLDRRGDVWVADFGMADVQGNAGLTRTGDLPGTLRYMSPEQALGKRSLVDRRTDIYSLGATLYEMLTLRPAVAGAEHQEIMRQIAEASPASVRRLNPAVPADLATILAKTLAKEPSARYETAGQLAGDLGRFLEGRPILARPVGPLARSWRWCKRKPIQASLAAALVLALAGGIAGITWNWRESVRQRAIASRERDQKEAQRALAETAQKEAQAQAAEARTQAARADAINRFLTEKLLGQAEPEANPAARQMTLLQALDRAAAEVGSSFTGRPDIEAGVRMAIGKAYHGLGQFRASETHYRAAHERLEHEPGADPSDRFLAMADLGHTLVHENQFDQAEPLLARAFEESQRALGPDHETSLEALAYFAELKRATGRQAEAELLSRRLVEDCRRFRGARADQTMTALNNLGVLLEATKKYAEAERIFREIMEYRVQTKGPEDLLTCRTYFNLGFVLSDLKRPKEAEKLLRQSLDGERRLLGSDHPSTLHALAKLAEVLATSGEKEEAEKLLRECLEARRRILGPNHSETLRTAKNLDAVVRARAEQKVAKAPVDSPRP